MVWIQKIFYLMWRKRVDISKKCNLSIAPLDPIFFFQIYHDAEVESSFHLLKIIRKTSSLLVMSSYYYFPISMNNEMQITCIFFLFGYNLYISTFTVNIALYQPAHQKKALKEGIALYDASNAVDGLNSNLRFDGGECVVSANGQTTATWWVNLTSIHSIHHIVIYYRTDNVPWRMYLFYIEIHACILITLE